MSRVLLGFGIVLLAANVLGVLFGIVIAAISAAAKENR